IPRISISSYCPCSFLLLSSDTAPTEIYTLSLHDALPISRRAVADLRQGGGRVRGRVTAAAGEKPSGNREGDEGRKAGRRGVRRRSEEHTSELQSRENLVCRLLLEKKKKRQRQRIINRTSN